MNTIFRRLPVGVIVLLLALSRTAFAEPESISWRDWVPPLDESLILEGDIAFGEQVRFELNNKEIRIPGFIVPVDFDDTQVVTRFLLVPYFGACIHEPAPPRGLKRIWPLPLTPCGRTKLSPLFISQLFGITCPDWWASAGKVMN